MDYENSLYQLLRRQPPRCVMRYARDIDLNELEVARVLLTMRVAGGAADGSPAHEIAHAPHYIDASSVRSV